MKNLLVTTLFGSLLLASTSAFASVGAVRVETNGVTGTTLGNICDAVYSGSIPVGISCVNPQGDGGGGSVVSCGTNYCWPYGALARSDTFFAYCQDTNGIDGVVMCQY